jgi:hypothetical protein
MGEMPTKVRPSGLGLIAEDEIRTFARFSEAQVLDESPDDSVLRKESVRAVVRKVFNTAVKHLGTEEALMHWEEIARTERSARRGHGARRGPRTPNNDLLLMKLYLVELKSDPGRAPSLPRMLAEMLHRNVPGEFGVSPSAIAKRVRRLAPKYYHEIPPLELIHAASLEKARKQIALMKQANEFTNTTTIYVTL